MPPTDDLGPVPEENRPGHHPEVEQDQPPGEAFARRLGLVAPPDEDADAEADAEAEAPAGAPRGGGPDRSSAPSPVSEPEPEPATAEAAMAVSVGHGFGGPPPGRSERTAAVDERGPVTAALLNHAGPPAGPVTPVEVVAETLELGVRFAIAAALLPARVTAASVRMALRFTGRDD
jgi:hypothetical protein